MIEIGTLVRWRDGDMGLVTQIHTTNRGTQAYRVQWFNGGSGTLSAWQFEVVA